VVVESAIDAAFITRELISIITDLDSFKNLSIATKCKGAVVTSVSVDAVSIIAGFPTFDPAVTANL
jgi:hypothetical protein